ncbi:MAG: PatB family C-S lyase [Bacteroidales bacterium]|nr:PatB family C-S lyase [Bacteroidales bacterium]
MKRRSFIKGVAAAGATTLLPAGAATPLLNSCSAACPAGGWNFDEVIDRSGTWSIKYGRAGKGRFAMWIADMDFRTDPVVKQALQDRLDRDVMGYTSTPEEFFEVVRAWEGKQHGWDIPREWVGYAPGVITAINQAYLCFTQPGDKIIVQPPVYDHFRMFAERLGREVVDNPMICENGRYRMDFEGLERLFDEKTKLLVLCNPHNPCGILWDRETLKTLAEICEKHGIIVVSDEIHADLALYGKTHIPFCSVCDAAARIGLIFGGPTKAFNLAGISGTAFCVIPDKDKREKYLGTLRAAKLDEPSIPTLVSTIAAYTSESGWLSALKEYLQGNIGCVMDFFQSNHLGISPIRPEASFLVWLDCRALNLPQEQLMEQFRDKAGVYLSNGAAYGQGGEGFVRLNIGSPRSVLMDALESIKRAFQR